MATVTVLQSVNMLSLPTNLFSGSSSFSSGGPLNVYSGTPATNSISMEGSFSINIPFITGTVARVGFNFDDNDLTSNFIIDDLSYGFSATYFSSVIYAGNVDSFVQSLLSGNDTVTGSKGADTLTGFVGDDFAYGLGGDDHLIGDVGSDHLYGGIGDDTIYGGGDKDVLVGGAGIDDLTGNAGRDTFLFVSIKDAPKGEMTFDTIEDFTRGDGDRIDLSAIDANSHQSGNQSFELIGKANFTGNDSDQAHRGELRYIATADGFRIFGDVTGDRNADFVIDVFTSVTAMKVEDFNL